MEEVKRKVQSNIRMDEERRREDFLEKQNEREQRESKLRKMRMKQMDDIKRHSIEFNTKIQNTISESKRQQDEKKYKVMKKQQIMDERLKMQKEKKLTNERKRKEITAVNNELKRLNSERNQRKEQYKLQKIKEKFEFDDMRRTAYLNEKREYKSIRLKNQLEAQNQRQTETECVESIQLKYYNFSGLWYNYVP